MGQSLRIQSVFFQETLDFLISVFPQGNFLQRYQPKRDNFYLPIHQSQFQESVRADV